MLGSKNEQVLIRRIGKCLNGIGWDVVRSIILLVETDFRMAADTERLELQYLDH